MISFLQRIKIKKEKNSFFFGGGGGGARIIDFF